MVSSRVAGIGILQILWKLLRSIVYSSTPQAARPGPGQRVGGVVEGLRAEAPHHHVRCLRVQPADRAVGEPASLAW